MGHIAIKTSDTLAEAIAIGATKGQGDALATYDGITLAVPSASNMALNVAAKQVLLSDVRSTRNQYMQSTDWTQMADSPLTPAKKSAWAEYRQSLRDITDQPDPNNITWPTPPA